MSDRLPSLTALRAFEAAARHMSFARAAEELHVTPAALSFQIKSLEEHLGQSLFRRLNRAVELTEAGTILAPPTQAAFELLNSGWQKTRQLQDTTRLTVTAGPGFTAKWLAPRLYGFASAHSEIELRLVATLRLLDFVRDDIDLAIRFGEGSEPALTSWPLFTEWWTPMMTPALAQTITRPEDLLALPLLHQVDGFLHRPITWQSWFGHFGLTAPSSGTIFTQADHVIDAGIAGAGILLGRASMAAEALREGRLIAPFPESLRPGVTYRMVCRPESADRPQIIAFRQWIEAEIRLFDDLSTGRLWIQS